jgi:hypothetical protein
MKPEKKRLKKIRREANAGESTSQKVKNYSVAGASGAAGLGAAVAGVAAARAAKKVGKTAESVGEEAKKTLKKVNSVAGAPGRAANKAKSVGKGLMKKIAKTGKRIVRAESQLPLNHFKASEVRKGVMVVDGNAISVPKLELLLKKKKVEKVPLKKVKGIGRQKGYSADRFEGASNALDKPGIIGTDGTLIDGRHRSRGRKARGDKDGLYRRASKKDLKAAMITLARKYRDVNEFNLAPGVYHGDRAVKKAPMFRHEYVAVVPEDEKALPKNVRRQLVKVGPNGEKALVSGGYNRRGRLRAKIGDRTDVKAIRKSIAKGKGPDHVATEGGNAAAIKTAEVSKRFGSRKYPGLIDNARGKGKNSNSYARTVLKENGVVRDPKKSNPGSNLYFAKKDEPNRQEKIATAIRKVAPTVRGAASGALVGAAVGNVPGAIAGGTAGALAQNKMAKVARKQERERKPLSAMATVAAVPAGAAAIAAGIKNRKKIMKKAKPFLKKLKHFESKLDDCLEFSKKDQFKRGPDTDRPGEFLNTVKVIAGAEKPFVSNPNHVKGSVDPSTASALIPYDGPIGASSQAWKGAYRTAKKGNQIAQRTGRVARDVGDVVTGKGRRKDSAGRPKKREWEKPYFRNTVAAGAGAAGLMLGGKALRENPAILSKVSDTTGPLAESLLKKTKNIGASYFEEDLDLRPGMIEFTESVSVRDNKGRQVFRVEDARGNSARIHQGDKPKRVRRKKKWHEKAQNERKLWKGAALGAAVAGVAAGAKGKTIAKGAKKVVKRVAAKAGSTKVGSALGKEVAKRGAAKKINRQAKKIMKSRAGIGAN